MLPQDEATELQKRHLLKGFSHLVCSWLQFLCFSLSLSAPRYLFWNSCTIIVFACMRCVSVPSPPALSPLHFLLHPGGMPTWGWERDLWVTLISHPRQNLWYQDGPPPPFSLINSHKTVSPCLWNAANLELLAAIITAHVRETLIETENCCLEILKPTSVLWNASSVQLCQLFTA